MISGFSWRVCLDMPFHMCQQGILLRCLTLEFDWPNRQLETREPNRQLENQRAEQTAGKPEGPNRQLENPRAEQTAGKFEGRIDS